METRRGPVGVVHEHRMDGRGARRVPRSRGFSRALRARSADEPAYPEDQILYIVTGTERAQKEGEERVEERVEESPDDVAYVAPGVKDWHGARPDTFMVHVAANPVIETGGGTDRMEPVTDEEHSGAEVGKLY